MTIIDQAEAALKAVLGSDKGSLLNGSVRTYYLSNNMEDKIRQALTLIAAHREAGGGEMLKAKDALNWFLYRLDENHPEDDALADRWNYLDAYNVIFRYITAAQETAHLRERVKVLEAQLSGGEVSK
jgi:hypothetical protein